jgi:hypothetical protein
MAAFSRMPNRATMRRPGARMTQTEPGRTKFALFDFQQKAVIEPVCGYVCLPLPPTKSINDLAYAITIDVPAAGFPDSYQGSPIKTRLTGFP